MQEKSFWSAKRIAFVVLFAAVGFVALQVKLFRYEGLTGKFFTWFEFIGPLAGAFLGPVFGALATLGARLINFILVGNAIEAVTLIPLVTLAFGALYFGTDLKEKITGKIALAVPIIAILAFFAHPVGREVWYFALFWLIPIAALFSKRLFAKALGATFTAHAVGGALWIWFVPFAQTASYWNTLLFVVPVERFIYAIGICISFVLFNTLLAKVEQAAKTNAIRIDERYVLGKSILKGF